MSSRQTKAELESWYSLADPWRYNATPDDQARKERILEAIPSTYLAALDIGAGEGFITKDLPARHIHAIELSDNAANRLPDSIIRVDRPYGVYDLVVATGVLYKQYDHEQMRAWIKESASKHIVTCHIKDWEIPYEGNEIHQEEFSYRDYIQILRVYEISS